MQKQKNIYQKIEVYKKNVCRESPYHETWVFIKNLLANPETGIFSIFILRNGSFSNFLFDL